MKVRLLHYGASTSLVALAWGAWLLLPFDSTRGDSDGALGAVASLPEWAIGIAMMAVGALGLVAEADVVPPRARWGSHYVECSMWLILTITLASRDWRGGAEVTTGMFFLIAVDRLWRFALARARS